MLLPGEEDQGAQGVHELTDGLPAGWQPKGVPHNGRAHQSLA